MDKRKHLDKTQLFYDSVMKIQSPEECKKFFEDILTPPELSTVAHRMQIAQMLLDGATYVEIQEETGASTFLINRTKTMLQQGHHTVEEVLHRDAEVESDS